MNSARDTPEHAQFSFGGLGGLAISRRLLAGLWMRLEPASQSAVSLDRG